MPDKRMPLLAIIADDLTGALDAAAPFAGRGLPVRVALSPAGMEEIVASGATVISVSTRSRELAPDAARAEVARVLAALPSGTRIFKKIDSRMKGNIAAELSALPDGPALAAPAIPDFGRIVRKGHVMGFGVDTPIAIAPLLGRTASIPDIATGAEMRATVEGAGTALLIGARGLALALARDLTGQRDEVVPPLAGPRAVLVVGSRDPITLAQVAALQDVPQVEAPNGIVPPLPLGEIVLIRAVPGETQVPAEEAAQNLAQGLKAIPRPDTLFLTGGATAEAVLTALGILSLHLLGECMPGLPVARAGTMTVVAKSGGFGDAATLVEIVRRIGGSTCR